MNKISGLIIMLLATVFIMSCEKEDAPELQKDQENTPDQIMDKIAPEIMAQDFTESDLKATATRVTLTAQKISGNTYKLTATINTPICKRGTGPIEGYWTLFSGAEGKNQRIAVTQAKDCLNGSISVNYTPAKNTIVRVVLLPFEPNGYLMQGYFQSNSVTLAVR